MPFNKMQVYFGIKELNEQKRENDDN